jgi:hypothetical protein
MKGETLVRQGLLPLLRGIGPVEIGPVEVRMKGKTRGSGRLLLYGLILGAVGGAGYVTYTQLPDLRRYLKIKSM